MEELLLLLGGVRTLSWIGRLRRFNYLNRIYKDVVDGENKINNKRENVKMRKSMKKKSEYQSYISWRKNSVTKSQIFRKGLNVPSTLKLEPHLYKY